MKHCKWLKIYWKMWSEILKRMIVWDAICRYIDIRFSDIYDISSTRSFVSSTCFGINLSHLLVRKLPVFFWHIAISQGLFQIQRWDLYKESRKLNLKNHFCCIYWFQLTCSISVEIDIGGLEPCIPCEFPFARSRIVEIPCVTTATWILRFVNHTARIAYKGSNWFKSLMNIFSIVSTELWTSGLVWFNN